MNDFIFTIATKMQAALDTKDWPSYRSCIDVLTQQIQIAQIFDSSDLAELLELRQVWYEFTPVAQTRLTNHVISVQ